MPPDSPREGGVGGAVELSPAGRVLPSLLPTASTYAGLGGLSRRCSGHVPKCRERGVVARSSERREATDNESEVVEPCGRILVEESACPSCACPSVSAWIVLCDERDELEGFAERDLADLAGGRLSDEQIPALDRTVEGRSRMSLRRQRAAFLGPDGWASLLGG
jgi:hypothetical protein